MPTPEARLAPWIARIFPNVRGVQEHPVFIRLSGQGLVRGAPSLRAVPEEIRALAWNGADAWFAVALFPILGCFWQLAPLVPALHVAFAHPRRFRLLIQDLAAGFRGDELTLAPFDPIWFDRALFAGLYFHSARRFLWAAGLSMFLAVAGASLLSQSPAPNPVEWHSAALRAMIRYGAAVVTLFGVMTLRMAFAYSRLGDLVAPVLATPLARFRDDALLCTTALLSGLGGPLVVYMLGGAMGVMLDWDSDALGGAAWFLLRLLAVTAYVAISCYMSFGMAANLQNGAEGEAHRALCFLTRKRHDPRLKPGKRMA